MHKAKPNCTYEISYQEFLLDLEFFAGVTRLCENARILSGVNRGRNKYESPRAVDINKCVD